MSRSIPGASISRSCNNRRFSTPAALLLTAAVWCVSPASAESHAIDSAKSTMTVHVGKTGVFSGFGHNHVIAAPIHSGTVDSAAHTVALTVNATALRVRDSDASEKDRAEIQKT